MTTRTIPITINAAGIAEIEQFLAINHKLGGEHFTTSMLRAWARDAEFQLAEGNPFHCPWDSGRSGWVYCTAEKAKQEFGGRTWRAEARERLIGEVETFAQYLSGDVYGYVVQELADGEWEDGDSCWGFYGLEHATEEARSAGEYQRRAALKEANEVAHWQQRDVVTA